MTSFFLYPITGVSGDWTVINTTVLNTTQLGDDVASPVDVLNAYCNTTIGGTNGRWLTVNLPADAPVLIDGTTIPHTDTDGVLDINVTTSTNDGIATINTNMTTHDLGNTEWAYNIYGVYDSSACATGTSNAAVMFMDTPTTSVDCNDYGLYIAAGYDFGIVVLSPILLSSLNIAPTSDPTPYPLDFQLEGMPTAGVYSEGRVINMEYGDARTISGTIYGMYMDFVTNITPADESIIGNYFSMPLDVSATSYGYYLLTVQDQGSGMFMDINSTVGAGQTLKGIEINADGATCGVGETFYAIHIDMDTITTGGTIAGIRLDIPNGTDAIQIDEGSINWIPNASDSFVIAPSGTGMQIFNFQLETEYTSGTLFNADFGAGTTLAGTLMGTSFDFTTNITDAADQIVVGHYVSMPLNVNAASYGLHILTVQDQGDAIFVDINSTVGTGFTMRGINVDADGATCGAGETFYAFNAEMDGTGTGGTLGAFYGHIGDAMSGITLDVNAAGVTAIPVDINLAAMQGGSVIDVDFTAAETLTGPLTGINLDIGTNVSQGGQTVTGMIILTTPVNDQANAAIGISLTNNTYNATGGAGLANSATGITITQNDINDVVQADTHTGMFLDLNMTLDNTAGGSVTRQTSPIIDIQVALTETLGTVAMNTGIMNTTIAAAATTPLLQGDMFNFETTGTGLIDGNFTIYDITQAFDHDDAAADAMRGFNVAWTGDVPGTNATTYLTLFEANFSGTLGASGANAVLRGFYADLTTTLTAGAVYGVDVDLSTAAAAGTVYGIQVTMPAAYGAATEAALHATGDGNVFDILAGDYGTDLAFTEAVGAAETKYGHRVTVSSTVNATGNFAGLFVDASGATFNAGAGTKYGIAVNTPANATSSIELAGTTRTINSTSADLTIMTTTSGDIYLDPRAKLDMGGGNSGLFTVDVSSWFVGISMAGTAPTHSFHFVGADAYFEDNGLIIAAPIAQFLITTAGSGDVYPVIKISQAGGKASIELEGATRTINSTSGDMTISTTTSGDVNINPFASINVTPGSNADALNIIGTNMFTTSAINIDIDVAADANNSINGFTITHDVNQTAAAASTHDGFLLNYTSTIACTNAGGSATRQTNPLINLAMTLTETAGAVAMTSGFISMSTTVGAGTPSIQGNLVDMVIDGEQSAVLVGNHFDFNHDVNSNNFYGIEVDTDGITNTGAAGNLYGLYIHDTSTLLDYDIYASGDVYVGGAITLNSLDITPATDIDAIDITGTNMTTASAIDIDMSADLTGSQNIVDISSTGGLGAAEDHQGIYLDFNNTIADGGANDADLYGIQVDLDGVTVTSAGNVYGLWINADGITTPGNATNFAGLRIDVAAGQDAISIGDGSINWIPGTGDKFIIAPTATDLEIIDFALETEFTEGILINADFGAPTTLTDTLYGVYFEFTASVTPANQDIIGMYVNLPADVGIDTYGFHLESIQDQGAGIFMDINSTVAAAQTLKGIDINADGVTLNDANAVYYGTHLNQSGLTLTNYLTYYGLFIEMQAAYGAGADAAIWATGNGNTFGALTGHGVYLQMREATSDAFNIDCNVANDTNNDQNVFVAQHNLTQTAAAAVTHTGFFISHEMLLECTNAGGTVTRQTNPIIDVQVALTETAGTVAMNTGIMNTTIAAAATTPLLQGDMFNFETTGTGLIDGNFTIYDITQAFDHDDAAADAMRGFNVAWTGDVPGTNATTYLTLFEANYSGTIGASGANTVLRGFYTDLTIALTAGTVYGAHIDIDGITVTDATAIAGLLIDMDGMTTPRNADYLSGVRVNVADGVDSAFDANVRMSVSGRNEEGAYHYKDHFSGRVWKGQWATDAANNAGDVNAAAPGSDLNGQTRLRTNAAAGAVMERHWNDIFCFDGQYHTTVEIIFIVRTATADLGDFQLEFGLVDAAETTYVRIQADYNADTEWHMQSSAAGAGTMDDAAAETIAQDVRIKARFEIVDNSVATGLRTFLGQGIPPDWEGNPTLEATTDAVNEIPADGVMMQPYVMLTSRAGGGGTQQIIDIDKIELHQDLP